MKNFVGMRWGVGLLLLSMGLWLSWGTGFSQEAMAPSEGKIQERIHNLLQELKQKGADFEPAFVERVLALNADMGETLLKEQRSRVPPRQFLYWFLTRSLNAITARKAMEQAIPQTLIPSLAKTPEERQLFSSTLDWLAAHIKEAYLPYVPDFFRQLSGIPAGGETALKQFWVGITTLRSSPQNSEGETVISVYQYILQYIQQYYLTSLAPWVAALLREETSQPLRLSALQILGQLAARDFSDAVAAQLLSPLYQTVRVDQHLEATLNPGRETLFLQALLTLGQLQDPSKVSFLIPLVRSDWPREVRLAALRSWRALHDVSSAKKLLPFLADPDADIQQAVIQTLVSLGDPQAIPSLQQVGEKTSETLGDLTDQLQQAAQGKNGQKLDTLTARQESLRKLFQAVLFGLDILDTIQSFLPTLSHLAQKGTPSDPDLVGWGLWQLAVHHAPHVGSLLSDYLSPETLEKEPVPIQAGVLRAVGLLHQTQALPLLLKSLRSNELDVRSAALFALTLLAPQKLDEIQSWLQGPQATKETKTLALTVIKELQLTSYKDPVYALLQDSEASMRANALETLMVLQPDEDRLTPLLDDSDSSVVGAAVRALTYLHSQKAQALIPEKGLLVKQTGFSKTPILQAYAALGIKGAQSVLLDAIRSENSIVKFEAAYQLSQLSLQALLDERSVTALAAFLKSEDPDVRDSAAFALLNLSDQVERAGPSALDPLKQEGLDWPEVVQQSLSVFFDNYQQLPSTAMVPDVLNKVRAPRLMEKLIAQPFSKPFVYGSLHRILKDLERETHLTLDTSHLDLATLETFLFVDGRLEKIHNEYELLLRIKKALEQKGIPLSMMFRSIRRGNETVFQMTWVSPDEAEKEWFLWYRNREKN